MDPDSYSSVLLPVVALLATNAFFVTAEFGLLSRQRARIETFGAGEGEAPSRRIRSGPRLDEMLLLAQLGRSISTLGLGYGIARLGLAAMELRSITASLELALALVLAAALHTVFSAQIPKLVAIHRHGELLERLVLSPLRVIAVLLRPIVNPLTRLVRLFARLLGITTPGFQPLVHTPEEIRRLVAQGHEQGLVEEDEREMIHGVFDFSRTVAREVMTPRIDMIAVPTEISLSELVEVVVREGHSRLPVYEGTFDAVVGVVLAKDLLPILMDSAGTRASEFDVRKVMREPYFVPDTKPVDDILAEFRQQSVHLAIVLDEFGGTYGLLTMEDLLEEIVGEIHDEYDVAEPEFTRTATGDVIIDGGTSISEVNERFGLGLPEEDFDTIGGYIFGGLGRVPVAGDRLVHVGEEETVTLHVEEIEDRRITRVRLARELPAQRPVPERE